MQNPTYHNIGEHSETVQLDYDPSVISYKKLLDVFWDSHDADFPASSRQYMSIIFYHDDKQKNLAEEALQQEAAKRKRKIHTLIRPFEKFYLAEDYHQKYRLRTEQDIVRELSAMYPGKEGFVNSTAAARINGYLDGYGTFDDLEKELPEFGLSPQTGRLLLDIVKRR